MGFKTTNYEIKNLGLIIPEAYAMITKIVISPESRAYATFDIQKSREDINKKASLEQINVSYNIDKTAPIYEQLYLKAKEEYFSNWQDDIVEKTDINE